MPRILIRVGRHKESLNAERVPITREVHVRPPREFNRRRGVLWRLLKFTYVLVYYGRRWYMKIEGWMYIESNLEKVFGVPKIFMKRTGARIYLLIEKVTDELLVSGRKDRI